MTDAPTSAEEEPHPGRGVRPAKVLGRGLGGVVIAAGVLILFGPFLLAPLTLAVRSFEALAERGATWRWLAAFAVALGVIGAQLLFAIQRNPLVRTLTVVVFSLIFAVGAWLFFAPEPYLPSFELQPPWWERLGRTGWIGVGVVTLVYSALYLFLLHRLDDRPWARRLQLFGGGDRSAVPAAEPTPH